MSNLDIVFQTINAIWKGAKLDLKEPGTVRVWEMALKDISTSSIMLGVEAAAMSDDKFAPNPGRFRRLCLDATEAQRQKNFREAEIVSSVRAKEAVDHRTPKELAYSACLSAFTRRVIAGDSTISKAALNILPKPGHGDLYGTNFDWEYVIKSAPIPSSSSYQDHAEAFGAMKEIFEREWAS